MGVFFAIFAIESTQKLPQFLQLVLGHAPAHIDEVGMVRGDLGPNTPSLQGLLQTGGDRDNSANYVVGSLQLARHHCSHGIS